MLGQIKDTDFRVYAVWVPCLPTDDESRVPNAMTKLADERVAHYWDRSGKLRTVYKNVMKWEQPAWDVYYLYGPDAEWSNASPPVPDYWMHQLRRLPVERLLDGEKLAEEVRKRLASR